MKVLLCRNGLGDFFNAVRRRSADTEREGVVHKQDGPED